MCLGQVDCYCQEGELEMLMETLELGQLVTVREATEAWNQIGRYPMTLEPGDVATVVSKDCLVVVEFTKHNQIRRATLRWSNLILLED